MNNLTEFQFEVLSIVAAGVMNGRNLRAALADAGIRKSGPMFYQMMTRLEEAKFVKGWYEHKEVEGQIIKERHYQILGNGAVALREARRFCDRPKFRPAFDITV